MANANTQNSGSERRISDSRLAKVRRDISSGTKQLATWVGRVDSIDNEISSLESNSSNGPIVIELNSRKTYYESKVDHLTKRVDAQVKTLSDYISKNGRLDDKRYGIE